MTTRRSKRNQLVFFEDLGGIKMVKNKRASLQMEGASAAVLETTLR